MRFSALSNLLQAWGRARLSRFFSPQYPTSAKTSLRSARSTARTSVSSLPFWTSLRRWAYSTPTRATMVPPSAPTSDAAIRINSAGRDQTAAGNAIRLVALDHARGWRSVAILWERLGFGPRALPWRRPCNAKVPGPKFLNLFNYLTNVSQPKDLADDARPPGGPRTAPLICGSDALRGS
jgi:hypothetical protein